MAEAALDESLKKVNLAYEQLRQLSIRDGLTGTLNTNAFREHISHAFELYRRHKTISTLVFIDVDKFKFINDEYGHLVGDNVLQKIASELINKSRAMDFAARYGGDEFAVLLPESTVQEASAYFERVKRNITIDVEGGATFQVRISFGTCEISNEFDSVEEWLSKDDEFMYQHKKKWIRLCCFTTYRYPYNADLIASSFVTRPQLSNSWL